MAWLQENWIIAVVGLVVAVVLLWWLFARKAPDEIEAPVAPPAEPKKPLEAVKPEIIAAEPARFKPKEPAPAPVAAPPPPAPEPEPVAEAPPVPEPEPAPAPAPDPEPAPEPVAEIPEEPTVPAEPVAETPAPTPPEPEQQPEPEPAPEPEPEPEPAAVVPEEPTVPPPAPEPVPEVVATPEPEPEPAPEPAPASAPAPAPAATSDNLQLLKGVGPKMVVLLNGLGVTSFQQIADWTDADVAVIDPQLGAFQGRIARDAIVDQAGYLARGDKAGFEAKYGALGGEL